MPRSRDEEIARGQQAAAILENPLCQEVFADIETLWLAAIRQSRPAQKEQREDAYRVLLGLDQFRAGLTSIMNTGKLAATADAQESVHGEGDPEGSGDSGSP